MKVKTPIFLIIAYFFGLNIQAQETENPFLELEMEVQEMFARMIQMPDDELKMKINDTIISSISAFLKNPASFDHQFDSLLAIGSIKSDDDKLKIYTWNVPFQDGTHNFYGYAQMKTKDEGVTVVELKHNPKPIAGFEQASLTPSNWYGALYYAVIHTKYKGEDLYTLLAYDPNDIFTKKKMIDVINIDTHGFVTFGRPIFQIQNKTQSRVVFEYSARVGMMLRYNEAMDMIVYDHLSPSSPAYEGRYQYYGPDFSYDAFEFDKGTWIHKEDIQIQQ